VRRMPTIQRELRFRAAPAGVTDSDKIFRKARRSLVNTGLRVAFETVRYLEDVELLRRARRGWDWRRCATAEGRACERVIERLAERLARREETLCA
jgi:hypothetical protein